MSPAAPLAEEAIGVECAWPVREVMTANRTRADHKARISRRAWRAIALAVVAGLLTAGGLSLKDSAIDISTVLPSGVPTQTE